MIWLNPLLAVAGYEPRAQGMVAALPHGDVFAPAHDLPSLWRVVGAIREMTARPMGSADSDPAPALRAPARSPFDPASFPVPKEAT